MEVAHAAVGLTARHHVHSLGRCCQEGDRGKQHPSRAERLEINKHQTGPRAQINAAPHTTSRRADTNIAAQLAVTGARCTRGTCQEDARLTPKQGSSSLVHTPEQLRPQTSPPKPKPQPRRSRRGRRKTFNTATNTTSSSGNSVEDGSEVPQHQDQCGQGPPCCFLHSICTFIFIPAHTFSQPA